MKFKKAGRANHSEKFTVTSSGGIRVNIEALKEEYARKGPIYQTVKKVAAMLEGQPESRQMAAKGENSR